MTIPVPPYLPYLILLLTAIVFICIKTKKLTIPGALLSAVTGVLVFLAAEIRGIMMLLTFFILAVLATTHKKKIKARLHGDNLGDMTRNAGQVLANGGIAGLTAVLTIIDARHAGIYLLMMAASLASALADTLSSELGMLYGRRFYNVITFKRDANGQNGVVSLEGFLIGAAGACIIAFIYTGLNHNTVIVILAGISGNLCDSVLGATLERRRVIGNNVVNFLNTLFAALVALILYHIY